jgi:DNA helicase IV
VPASAGRARWTLADLFLLDEIAGLMRQPPRFGHVVIDEAQDLSPIQLRCVMRRCANSATLLGDMAQRTTPWAAGSWQAVAEHVGTASEVLTLTTSFRVPRDIVRLANALLPVISPELPPTVSGRHVPGAVAAVRCANAGDALVTLLREAEAHPDSVGILLADARFDAVRRQLAAAGFTVGLPHEADDAPDPKFALVPAGLAKGLEFDHVVLLEPGQVAASGEHGLRLLYIALTRAISKLTILHEDELPPLISVL